MSRIGIISALPDEARCLYKKRLSLHSPVEIQKNLYLCLSGIGADNARQATIALLNHNIDALISWGVAGALDPSLKSGDIILSDTIIDRNSKKTVSQNWIERINDYLIQISMQPQIVSMLITNEICTDPKSKSDLHLTSKARAVDMESAAIADMASEHGLDMIVIRAIADDAETRIPEVVAEHTNELGQPRIWPFILSCCKNPRQVTDLIRLARCFKKGITSLKHCAYDLKKEHFLYNTGRF